MRTTCPISPTETYKPTAHTPSWYSRVTTPGILSGSVTQRRPHCGTMTMFALIGGAPIRPWKAQLRLRCYQLPTGMNFSTDTTELWRASCRPKVRRSDSEMLRRERHLSLCFSPLWVPTVTCKLNSGFFKACLQLFDDRGFLSRGKRKGTAS